MRIKQRKGINGVERLLTTGQVAKRCSVTRDTVVKWIRGGRTKWIATDTTIVDLSSDESEELFREAPADRYPFAAVEMQVNRGARWSEPVTACFSRRSGRVLAVKR